MKSAKGAILLSCVLSPANAWSPAPAVTIRRAHAASSFPLSKMALEPSEEAPKAGDGPQPSEDMPNNAASHWRGPAFPDRAQAGLDVPHGDHSKTDCQEEEGYVARAEARIAARAVQKATSSAEEEEEGLSSSIDQAPHLGHAPDPDQIAEEIEKISEKIKAAEEAQAAAEAANMPQAQPGMKVAAGWLLQRGMELSGSLLGKASSGSLLGSLQPKVPPPISPEEAEKLAKAAREAWQELQAAATAAAAKAWGTGKVAAAKMAETSTPLHTAM